MERPPVFHLDVLADRTLIRDVLKGVLCTIFFHRFFRSVRPHTRELLDITLPAFDEKLDEMIDARAAELVKVIEGSPSSRNKGQLAVQFYERRPRKSAWFGTKGDEKICWEQWVLNVTLVAPRTEQDRIKQRKQIEKQLQTTVVAAITHSCQNHSHVPPITSNDPNPFPYEIVVHQKGGDNGWGTRMGIF